MALREESPQVFTSMGKQCVGMLHTAQTDKLIVMCHGFTSHKTENRRLFVEAAREFARHGYNVFRFDFYGSGDSEGEFAETLVSRNIVNLRDALAWAREKGFARCAVLGSSMGAATAILAAADLDIEALVLWSTVPDMQRLFESIIKDPQAAAETAAVYEHDGWLIRREFLFDAVSYDVQKAFAAITLPKLVLQGTADAPLFVQGFRELQKIAQPPADFMEIPEGGHTFQKPAHRQQVIRQTAIWLKRHF
ncbi:MAG TPA: alpha/beta fold hydrolase [bacterium]|jgi:pimeloyl-ACP methyl ester carboxylesterase|nr:alpha/beta fold hydrolase [bacterium]HNT66169.1 alpha/beta fold hydrolase [bacterium]